MCAAILLAAVTAAPARADTADTAAGAGTADLFASGPHGVGWALKDTGPAAAQGVRFRGLSAVGRNAAWVAGSRGTVLRTGDGGRSWQDVSPPGAVAEGLELRDIEAFDARRAVALSTGEGAASRILRTEDGGATWTEAFRNPDPRAFYDCLAFFDSRHGLAVSDPVDGRFRVLATDDGGRAWRVLPDAGMPQALPGEAGFAAGGQCLVTSGPRDVWLATGGGPAARVMHSADRGLTWRAADSTVPAGDPARGAFALAFRDRTSGLAVGGDYRTGLPSPLAAARSADGGRTWTQAAAPPPAYRSGVAWYPYGRTVAPAVGPTGTDVTPDAGRSRRPLDGGSFDTVGCAADGGCWAAGEKGRVARLEPRR
ncbi:oxidoreductase [Streptomyces sp. NPDC006662]|uniref:WD40/YVTN/BNR-like repeat-containing protein n=1 Tax=Streptomyces sp. NPDC006662 TaxID=3156902 RepID=UPI0033FB6A8E